MKNKRPVNVFYLSLKLMRKKQLHFFHGRVYASILHLVLFFPFASSTILQNNISQQNSQQSPDKDL